MVQWSTARLKLVVLVVMLGLVAAACSASSRTKALRVNLVALNTARDAVLAVSREREKQIYDRCNPSACTKEEGYARVEAWQKKVDAAVKAIDVGYRAVHDAALLDDAKSTREAHAAFVRALVLVRELEENPPVTRRGQEP